MAACFLTQTTAASSGQTLRCPRLPPRVPPEAVGLLASAAAAPAAAGWRGAAGPRGTRRRAPFEMSVEAAYDMLLMQSLTQRRAGKVVNSSIRYADVKPVRTSQPSSLPRWLQTTVKNAPVSVETPSTRDLGIQAGVYGALAVFTFASGASSPSGGTYTGADVPGIILATSFGASLYFLTKKTSSLGKATLITVGGLVIGAAVGSVVEQWLQVDIVPFFGIHSPAVIVSEFILFSQFLVSLYLR
ncbi:uncharacterized protein A4U43_C10F2030 [Asparagus officinalis]|uniref:Uncharacterized protein n=1 Tax=Asparagus officinalis TaxID=4686 RepID=A0A5P1E022_ASPOF|nr:uncharacterized protein A4U43_C10F2030 [Asparagus officinalis]